MNSTIIRRWNTAVKEEDIVFYLGDFCTGDPRQWINKLNGRIIFIQGNHDHKLRYTKRSIIFSHGNENILLIHKPERPNEWNGWIIHGHVHNHNVEVHPLINKNLKMINVSAELLNYNPIEENTLLSQRFR
jgi:calcineurin-like phosphoesterase family protein